MKINDIILQVYKDLGLEEIKIKIQKRKEKRVGQDEIWDSEERVMMKVMEKIRKKQKNIKKGIMKGEGEL